MPLLSAWSFVKHATCQGDMKHMQACRPSAAHLGGLVVGLDGLGALPQLGAHCGKAEVAQVAPHPVPAVQRDALPAAWPKQCRESLSSLCSIELTVCWTASASL